VKPTRRPKNTIAIQNTSESVAAIFPASGAAALRSQLEASPIVIS
jgi:hypothetical protein